MTEVERLHEELRIARFDAEVPVRELREQVVRLEAKVRLADVMYRRRVAEIERLRQGRCVECGNAHMTGEALPLPGALDQERPDAD